MREPKYNSIGFKDSFIDRDERKAARQAKRKKRREDWKNRNELTSYVVGQNEQGNDIIRVTTNKRKKRMEKKSDRDDRRNERKDKIKKSKGKKVKQTRRIRAQF
jgi:hypothetical protein